MPVEEYYKSFSFKLIGRDVFLSTIAVFGIMFLIPKITDFEALKPFRKAVEDFDITDVYFNPDIRGELPPETDITIIQTAVPTRDGLKEVSTKNYLKLINAIRGYEPKVIAVDHDFSETKKSPLFPAIKGILTETQNIVLARTFPESDENLLADTISSESPVYEIPAGFDNLLIGEDKTISSVRNFKTKQIESGDTTYHYAIEVARKFNPDAVDRFLERGNDMERINFRGNLEKFKILSARDIIKGKFEETDIRNKIIMFGYVGQNMSVADISDLYFTPLNENTAGRTFPDMYKLIVDANIVSMLLTDEYIDKLSKWITFLFAFVLCYLNMLFFGYIGYRYKKLYEITALITFMIETFAIGYLTVYLFEKYQLESNFTLAIVATALSIPIFELYTDTIKPFFEHLFRKQK